MDDSVEIWKNIPGYNGRYQASSHGQIKAVGHPRRINHTFVMKPQNRGQGGYLGVGLYHPLADKAKSHFIHILILLTFVGPRPPGMQGNHINLDKRDNRISNLEYLTFSANTRHALKAGVKKSTGKGRCLTPPEVREIQAYLLTEEGRRISNRKLGNIYEVSHETIRAIRLGKRWQCLDE